MTVPAANRVLDLIEIFSERRRPMTVAMLAKALELPTSSCHGLIKTLESRGYLINLKDQGGYYFSKRLEQHAQRIGGFNALPPWVLPALEAARDASDETTLLAKPAGSNAMYLEVLESAQSIRYIAQVGDLRPLYASAAGKALLGSLPEKKRRELLDGIELFRHSPNTLVTREALERDLALSASRGWYMTQGEFFADVTAVSAPFEVGADRYAVVIAGPSQRMQAQLERHVQLVVGLARRARTE